MLTRVSLLGTGLIGGSIGLGLRAARPEIELIGYDPRRLSGSAAVARGAVDRMAPTPVEAAAQADLVVLCMPTDQIPEALHSLQGALRGDAVVTDVGSAKTTIVAAGEAALKGRFLGGHPLAGSEQHGIEAADGELFVDAQWVLTPTATTDSDAYPLVTELVLSLGATPVALEAWTHDALVARLSHVPQLVASALVELAASAGQRDELLGLAGRGFKDVTRIAASNPDLWVGIIRSNSQAVVESLAGLENRVDHLRALITEERWDELQSFLGLARSARLELFAKPSYGGEPVSLAMMVPDRPGVLAEVTTAATRLSVNIEDLRIVHSTEGGRGRLELVVAGKERAERLVGALVTLGYRVERNIE